jgi:hypothetical protein
LNFAEVVAVATLTGEQVRALDPYAFLAMLGKRVIQPGGRASTDRLLEPFEMMTARGFLADERGHAPAVMARAIGRPAYLLKMAWLMPRMSRAIPFLGYVLASTRKPAAAGAGAAP